MSKSKQVVEKENVVQAIVVADTFDDEFVPLSDTTPHVGNVISKKWCNIGPIPMCLFFRFCFHS